MNVSAEFLELFFYCFFLVSIVTMNAVDGWNNYYHDQESEFVVFQNRPEISKDSKKTLYKSVVLLSSIEKVSSHVKYNCFNSYDIYLYFWLMKFNWSRNIILQ